MIQSSGFDKIKLEIQTLIKKCYFQGKEKNYI